MDKMPKFCMCCQGAISSNSQAKVLKGRGFVCENCIMLLNRSSNESSAPSSPRDSDCSCKRGRKSLCPSCVEKKCKGKTKYQHIYTSSESSEHEESNSEEEQIQCKKSVISSPASEFTSKLVPRAKSRIEVIRDALSRSKMPSSLHKKAERQLLNSNWIVKSRKIPLMKILKKLTAVSSKETITSKPLKKSTKPANTSDAGIACSSTSQAVNTDFLTIDEVMQRYSLLEQEFVELKRRLEDARKG